MSREHPFELASRLRSLTGAEVVLVPLTTDATKPVAAGAEITFRGDVPLAAFCASPSIAGVLDAVARAGRVELVRFVVGRRIAYDRDEWSIGSPLFLLVPGDSMELRVEVLDGPLSSFDSIDLTLPSFASAAARLQYLEQYGGERPWLLGMALDGLRERVFEAVIVECARDGMGAAEASRIAREYADAAAAELAPPEEPGSVEAAR